MPYINRKVITPDKKTDRAASTKRRSTKWNKYYQSPFWKRMREHMMREHPLCYDCALEGRSVPAEEVHHIVPFSWFEDESDRMKVLLDEDILVTLCKSCHLKRHATLKRPENFENTSYYKKIHDNY